MDLRPIRKINAALLGKWLWHLGDSSDDLWKDILRMKYRLLGSGWRAVNTNRRDSGFWKGVCFIAPTLERHIRYRAYTGEDVLFWLDKWLGEAPLVNVFPALYSFVANKQATVKDCYEFIQNKIIWGPQFRRDLEDWMVDGWMSLMILLGSLFVQGQGNDQRIWEYLHSR